jgi:hypothetical protein
MARGLSADQRYAIGLLPTGYYVELLLQNADIDWLARPVTAAKPTPYCYRYCERRTCSSPPRHAELLVDHI